MFTLYAYMDDWEVIIKNWLLEKSRLRVKDITDADYTKAKRVCKGFEIKKLGWYHDLYAQSDRILLADVS